MIPTFSSYLLKFWLVWACILTPTLCHGVKVEGRITDEKGQGLAFATVHQKHTTHGTTSNAQGFYSLELRGEESLLVYQYVGYQTVERAVQNKGDMLIINVQMVPEVVQLEALVVTPGAEDPAFGIIRQAIANRKKHLSEIRDYHCQVYIKGLQRLDEVPQKILGIPVTVDTGIVYLSESVSELSFQRPNKIKERVTSSKVSGDNRAFSFNQASDILINFYENQIYSEGLSERTFISPIAENALLFYDYELLGTIEDDGRIINKIQVFPKRNHDPTFSGLIYIIENSWRLHSINLLLTKGHQIEFVDSLRVRQVLAPMGSEDQEVWALLSQQFDFLLNAFGFKGAGHFVGVYTDYTVNQGFPNKYFTNEIVAVEPNSNQKDSIYWRITRPIPLTTEEVKDYHFKDSIQLVKESKYYQDSVDKKNNAISPTNIFLTGKTIRKSYSKRSWNVPPVIQIFQFNTVEGFVPYLRLSYTQRYEDYRYYRLIPEIRYGFSNERFNAQLTARYYYNPLKFASVELTSGRFVEQLNENSTLEIFDNTYYTLFEERNFLKIYEKAHFKVTHDSELTNGLRFIGSLEWSQRRPLQNTTDYTFNDREEREFTPNFPDNIANPNTGFLKHQALIWRVQLKWQPGQQYIRRPYRKFITKRKYPAITALFQAVFPDWLGSDLDYQWLAGQIGHSFKLGLFGSGEFLAELGGFLSSDSLSFIDFKHFHGNRTIFGHFELGNFQLLDYYRFSTVGTYYQGHYEHHFNGFIFNKIPLLRKTKIQAVAAINYLNTQEADDYWELGLGIEHIFKVLRVDYYNSWLSGRHHRNGIRIGLGF